MERSERAQSELGRAPQTYRREERSEKQLPGGGNQSYYFSESVTVYGPPPLSAIPTQGTSFSGRVTLSCPLSCIILLNHTY